MAWTRSFVTLSVCLSFACAAPVTEEAASSDAPLISDAASMTQRSDGRFDVKCKDGRSEVATTQQLQAGEVCNPVPAGLQPFENCSGPEMTLLRAEARFPTAQMTVAKGTGRQYGRTRRCVARSTGPDCTPWEPWDGGNDEVDIVEWKQVDAHTVDICPGLQHGGTFCVRVTDSGRSLVNTLVTLTGMKQTWTGSLGYCITDTMLRATLAQKVGDNEVWHERQVSLAVELPQ